MLAFLLRRLQARLQKEKLEKFKRRVSLGDLVTDRRQNAQEYGFGEGTSCYDNVLVLGNVTVGKHCWIGPNVILDGTGNLVIGDYVCIDAGVQIYSHDSSLRFYNMGQGEDPRAATTIGSGVFIGPNTIITMGVTVGDRVRIGAMSFVNRSIPSGATAFGVPARVQG
jgi:acetyltransferase-like isoleucine patch superfamily enzyme